jgi:hypothetical protein
MRGNAEGCDRVRGCGLHHTSLMFSTLNTIYGPLPNSNQLVEIGFSYSRIIPHLVFDPYFNPLKITFKPLYLILSPL